MWLLAAVDLIADGPNRVPFEPTAKVGPRIQALCENNGLLIRDMGDSIGFCPPLIIDEATIVKMIDRFSLSLDQALDWAKKDDLI